MCLVAQSALGSTWRGFWCATPPPWAMAKLAKASDKAQALKVLLGRVMALRLSMGEGCRVVSELVVISSANEASSGVRQSDRDHVRLGNAINLKVHDLMAILFGISSTTQRIDTKMNKSIEQALNSIIPRHSGALPPELIDLARSLLTQSRTKTTLKADEEIGRTFACANLACERYVHSLNPFPAQNLTFYMQKTQNDAQPP